MTKQKILWGGVLLLALLLVLTGCSPANITQWTKGFQKNAHQVELQPSMDIPPDGIISQEIFAALQEQNAAMVFTGEDTESEIFYQWTVFGADIHQPKDLNLALTFAQEPSTLPSEEAPEETPEDLPVEVLAFRFVSQEDFGFSPVLSIYYPEPWQAQSATVRIGDTPLGGATLTTSRDTTVFNFSVTSPQGDCWIIGDPVEPAMLEEQAPETAKSPTTTEDSPTDTAKDTLKNTTPPPPSGEDYLSIPGTTQQETAVAKPQTKQSLKERSGPGAKDKYNTDPTPPGKPTPVEPEDTTVDSQESFQVTFSIDAMTILNHLEDLNPAKLEILPRDGIILATTSVTVYQGESVADVLARITREHGIHMESSWTADKNSVYVEGIHNLYEFDCGNLSGWMYQVNGWYPNYGASRYQLNAGDDVRWRYTCDLGRDVGSDWALDG